MDVFEAGHEHEQVVFANDPATGLRAIIAIHSTALGPALGGTRFFPYATTAAALADVLDLSRGMSYKAALAGLDLGGGKAVLIGDPAKVRPGQAEALFRAYGRFVQSLGGRYYTACDVGTFSPDMDDIARECSYVTGRTVAHGGAGDSSVLTAYGVYQGLRAAAQFTWGAPSLEGRTVGVAGVGKVGHPPGRPPARGRRVASSSPTSAPPRSTACAPSTPTSASWRRPRSWSPSRWTSTRPARWAAPSPTRWSTCSPRGSSAARPTTSSPTRASRRRSRSAASSTRPTTASTPAG